MAEHSTDKKIENYWDPSERYKDTAIAEEYDRIRFASVSGRVFDKLEKAALKRSLADLPPNSLILDAPSGTGRLAEAVLEMGHRVVGVDISPQMLAVAEKKLARFGDKYTTHVSDVKDLDFEDGHFDAVLCARVLMHFPLNEQIDFLAAVSRLSKGPVIFNQSVLTAYHRGRRLVKKALGNQTPANYPLMPNEKKQLLDGVGLKQTSKFTVLPLVSEAVFYRCEPKK